MHGNNREWLIVVQLRRPSLAGHSYSWRRNMHQPSHEPVLERLERALLLLAYFIELDGDMHVPMYEKLEAALLELKRHQTTKERALRLLSTYSRAGGTKAICSKNLSLSSSDGPLPYLGL